MAVGSRSARAVLGSVLATMSPATDRREHRVEHPAYEVLFGARQRADSFVLTPYLRRRARAALVCGRLSGVLRTEADQHFDRQAERLRNGRQHGDGDASRCCAIVIAVIGVKSGVVADDDASNYFQNRKLWPKFES